MILITLLWTLFALLQCWIGERSHLVLKTNGEESRQRPDFETVKLIGGMRIPPNDTYDETTLLE
jgi:hypothetical protein